jgi:hypothetical protein
MSYDSSYSVDDFPTDIINDLFSLDADCFTSFDTNSIERNGKDKISPYVSISKCINFISYRSIFSLGYSTSNNSIILK